MTTQLSPVHTDLPPPARYLLHDERPVAWLSGNRFGFSGFADPTEAANAAWVAFRTISRKLAPVLGVRPSPIDIEPLRIEWRDGAETIFASHRPIAALVRPDADAPSAPRWFGFTIEVPPEIAGRQLRGAVHAAHRALLKSGVRWSMIRPRRGYRACIARVPRGPDSQRPRQSHLQRRSVPMSEQPEHSGWHSFDVAADAVDGASFDSFPASDPPNWSGLRAGPPVHRVRAQQVMAEEGTSVQSPTRAQRGDDPRHAEGLP
jgi:hypothetical protein